jgi:hypothetical protein
MLFHGVEMKAVDPVVDTIADAISTIILWKLHNPAETECTKSGIDQRARRRCPCDVTPSLIRSAKAEFGAISG